MVQRPVNRKKIDWREGSSTVVVYIAVMWLITLACVLFVEYFNLFSHVGKSQIYADVVADGSAFYGNNGWGLDEEKAKEAHRKLGEYNEDNFDGTKTSIGFSETKDDGQVVQGGENINTVDATAKLKTSMLTEDTKIRTQMNASTKITFSGGLRIVLEAYKHSYSYFKSDAGQTWYVWGGGHGSDTEWEQFADCSGFVSGVFRKCGYDIPNWACTWNMETMGELIGTGLTALDSAKPGDIILYWYDLGSTSAHVAIYAGKHNGVHYQIHSSGGQANSYSNPGRGSMGHGVVVSPVNTGAAKIMVRRMVDKDAKVYETPKVVIPGLTENQSTIYFTLSSLGFSDVVVAGIIGNWANEGNCSPIVREGHSSPTDSWNTSYAEKLKNGEISKISFVYEGKGRMSHKGSEGYGIAQWTTTQWDNAMNDRKAALWDFTNGKVYDIQQQICFAVHELPNLWGDGRDNVPAQYMNVSYQEFLHCEDPALAAKLFLAHFEGVWDGSDVRRSNTAVYIYNKINAYRS